jgi:hypothetical protein
VKVTESDWLPAFKTVPAAGVYANVPATAHVASNCVELRGVPYVIDAGGGQEQFTAPGLTVNDTLAVAVV